MQWFFAYAPHEAAIEVNLKTIEEIESSGFPCIAATVPGNFEIDLMREKKIGDLHFSTNTFSAQKWETTHLWYFTTLEVTDTTQLLQLDGIDTYSEVYVNGVLVGETDNMFLPYTFRPEWKQGRNEIVVHIRPAMLEARKFTPPATCHAQKYNFASLYTRKAAYMYGWDIMPRIVSAGIWKPVRLISEKSECINEIYAVTSALNLEQKTAWLRFYLDTTLEDPMVQNYSIRFEGVCGDSVWSKEQTLWNKTCGLEVEVKNCHFWWPKNAGKPELYDVTVTLLHNGEPCDIYRLRQGIRTVSLVRTEKKENEICGDFYFLVNGKKTFIMGTNWVPLDSFPSQFDKRRGKALALLDDTGCNMVRCWGGGIYEADEFYDFCDEHGIMVWQDFMLGCAVYPDDAQLASAIEKEVVFHIKRLRNHASLALWAGDNECDEFRMGQRMGRPEQNELTRKVLRRAVELHDYSHDYLPSSPYYDDAAFSDYMSMPEKHLWGPRDYYKSQFYMETFCRFASELGYHGFNSPQSLRRFLREPEKVTEENGDPTAEYIAHATDMEPDPNGPCAFRVLVPRKQVITLFGKAEECFEDFLKQSQISQAEACKFYIEMFRTQKWNRTGLIWWNLLDGCPQLSDAVVDYYFVKKLAYFYIKRAQQPLCLMMSEPKNGCLGLMGINDLPEEREISYKVSEVTEDGTLLPVYSGECKLAADSAENLVLIPLSADTNFYLMEWTMDGKTYFNHYVHDMKKMSYERYLKAITKCGMDEFEGFEEA